jgi:hypothetical protein
MSTYLNMNIRFYFFHIVWISLAMVRRLENPGKARILISYFHNYLSQVTNTMSTFMLIPITYAPTREPSPLSLTPYS